MKIIYRTLSVFLALVLSLGATAYATNLDDYVFLTSKDEKVVTQNGPFDLAKLKKPVLVTSIGQSADVSMLDVLLKKVKADYTFNQTVKAEEAKEFETLIIAAGASSKGLGAAGISKEDEVKRAEELMALAKEKEMTVILMHLGGGARRGPLSDQFSDMVLAQSDYIIMVEDGNRDGKFTDFAKENEIPITLLSTIADALTVLKDLFPAATE